MAHYNFYYDDHGYKYLELHDHHTLWSIEQCNLSDYDFLVRVAISNMEHHYKDLQVLALGRSGRHICVEDTAINRRRYWHLVKCAELLEKNIINYFNEQCEEN